MDNPKDEEVSIEAAKMLAKLRDEVKLLSREGGQIEPRSGISRLEGFPDNPGADTESYLRAEKSALQIFGMDDSEASDAEAIETMKGILQYIKYAESMFLSPEQPSG